MKDFWGFLEIEPIVMVKGNITATERKIANGWRFKMVNFIKILKQNDFKCKCKAIMLRGRN